MRRKKQIQIIRLQQDSSGVIDKMKYVQTSVSALSFKVVDGKNWPLVIINHAGDETWCWFWRWLQGWTQRWWWRWFGAGEDDIVCHEFKCSRVHEVDRQPGAPKLISTGVWILDEAPGGARGYCDIEGGEGRGGLLWYYREGGHELQSCKKVTDLSSGDKPMLKSRNFLHLF